MGLHCAPAAHRSIGSFELGGTIRLSPGPFTTEAEIDEALRALEHALTR
jgi:selenocysteine lyase/cysteine desulfurase